MSQNTNSAVFFDIVQKAGRGVKGFLNNVKKLQNWYFEASLRLLLSDIANELISCLIMVEVNPFNPTKESTFLIWYFVSGRAVGINKRYERCEVFIMTFPYIPSLESLQAPLIWRTKSFLILQAAHSLSSSSTSLSQQKFSLGIEKNCL